MKDWKRFMEFCTKIWEQSQEFPLKEPVRKKPPLKRGGFARIQAFKVFFFAMVF